VARVEPPRRLFERTSQNGTTGSQSQVVGYAAAGATTRSAELHAKGAGQP
jgi:hypothetical protein